MRYTLLLYYPELSPEQLTQEAMAEGARAFEAYTDSLVGAGVFVSAEMFGPTASTVTVIGFGDEAAIVRTPRTDEPEKLGGSVVIEVDDEESAIAWARRAPSAAWGQVEIRPTAMRFVDGHWA